MENLITNISIDKITIVADLKKEDILVFQKIVDFEPFADLIHLKNMDMAFVLWKENDEGSVYINVTGRPKRTLVKSRQFRMEFNPNKMSESQLEFISKNVLPYITNASFSRVDIAFDSHQDLSQFTYIQDRPQKRSQYWGRNGKTETMYFGTRNSDKLLRIYNKKQERIDNGNLDDNDDECLWWRLEFVLRKDLVNFVLKDTENTPFDGLHIVIPRHKSLDIDIKEQGWLYFVIENPDELGNFKRSTRTKLKKLLVDSSEKDYTEDFVAAFKEKRKKLQLELQELLDKTQKTLGDVLS